MDAWNNADDKQYSRNLGKSEGIELFFVDLSDTKNQTSTINSKKINIKLKVTQNTLAIKNCEPDAEVQIFDSNGVIVKTDYLTDNKLNINELAHGDYSISIKDKRVIMAEKFTKK